MALQPGTNKQIPDHSIMDYFNKQVYLGNQFTANTDVVSLTGTSEVPFIYLGNPAVTTAAFPVNNVALFNTLQKLACNDVTGATGIVFRVYSNPTSVSGGSAITPQNCRFASPTTSVATVLKSPTVVSKGALIATFSVGWENQNLSNVMLILDPSQSMLVTAQSSASTQGLALLEWFEL